MKKISIKIFFLLFLFSCSNNQDNISTNIKKLESTDKNKTTTNTPNDVNKTTATTPNDVNKTNTNEDKTVIEKDNSKDLSKTITDQKKEKIDSKENNINNDKNIKNSTSKENIKVIPVNVSKVEVVALYNEFKQKNQLELQKKINSKIVENYNVEIYLNKGLVNVLSPIDSLTSNPNDGDEKNLSSGILKSYVIMNSNSSKINFISSSIIVELQSKLKLEDLNKLYNIKVINENRGIYSISVDINKADISKLPNLIKEYNKNIFVNIKNIQFSSVASMKTFTILLDILANHKDICKSANLNTLV